MNTSCEVYGLIWDETYDAQDCPQYQEDPDKT